mmetsp:Transcript_26007/g.72655  ORF Transcript_26007/g.72655 Transcript_26007/m.72655 type:complete len:248 (+) Transcript_26007:458-1201(+)
MARTITAGDAATNLACRLLRRGLLEKTPREHVVSDGELILEFRDWAFPCACLQFLVVIILALLRRVRAAPNLQFPQCPSVHLLQVFANDSQALGTTSDHLRSDLLDKRDEFSKHLVHGVLPRSPARRFVEVVDTTSFVGIFSPTPWQWRIEGLFNHPEEFLLLAQVHAEGPRVLPQIRILDRTSFASGLCNVNLCSKLVRCNDVEGVWAWSKHLFTARRPCARVGSLAVGHRRSNSSTSGRKNGKRG